MRTNSDQTAKVIVQERFTDRGQLTRAGAAAELAKCVARSLTDRVSVSTLFSVRDSRVGLDQHPGNREQPTTGTTE